MTGAADSRACAPASTRRLLVVNSGLLGARTFGAELLPQVAVHAPGLRIQQTLLSGPLTLAERGVRSLLCQRMWTDRWPALSNLDLARYRLEWHAGLLARHRLGRVPPASFDAVLFYRQPAAYASLSLLRSLPSIVAIDCTQDCVRASMRGALARATLRPNVHRDGLVFDAATLIVANSAWAASSLRALYPRCRTPIDVFPPPVHLSVFDERWVGERAARASHGEAPRVLFIGGDFRRKGGFALLQTWREAGLGATARLDIVSEWPLNDRDLPPGVTVHRGVLPYSDRWLALWASADVFAMPTRHEAFGMVYQEAAAAGLPRIGTRENAGPELIHDGTDGFLIDPGDTAALARRLTTLVAEPALRQAMGRAAREFIETSAGMERYAANLERAVDRAIGRYQRRGAA